MATFVMSQPDHRRKYIVWTRCRKRAQITGLGLGFFEALEFLAGFEAYGFAGGDADFFAGARVAANAGFARFDAEDAKAAKFDALAAAQRHFERLEDGLHGLLRFGAANVR